jgi:hypothetical protein
MRQYKIAGNIGRKGNADMCYQKIEDIRRPLLVTRQWYRYILDFLSVCVDVGDSKVWRG